MTARARAVSPTPAAAMKCLDGGRPITRSQKKNDETLDLFAPAPTEPAVVEPAPAEQVEATPTPAWAIEAATAPASQPEPELQARDFAAATERVWDGADRFVLRARVFSGHEYHAYERSNVFAYGTVLEDDPVFGRLDTRLPTHGGADPHKQIEEQLEREAEARRLIYQLCPETRLCEGERAVDDGVYGGPGRVLVTVDPESRYQAAIAARGPA